MLKLSKRHEIYEVWNEWAAESVFVDHKPSRDEIKELIQTNDWFDGQQNLTLGLFMKKFIHVERLQHFYTTDPKTYLLERGTDD